MDIIEFYTGVLGLAGLKTDDEGKVHLALPEGTTPLTIQGQTLVLPTREILKQHDKSDLVVFHPVCEGIGRKESPVFKRYRKVLQYQLNWIMAELLTELMDVAVDTTRHAKLSPDQADFLTLLSDADEKTLNALTKVIGKVDNEKVDRRLISIYIKRSALLRGKEHPRGAIVTFPILDCLKVPEAEIFGVKMRAKDKAAIVKLFEFILPRATEINEYSYGTADLVAPNLYSLIMAAVGIAEKFNDKVALYGGATSESQVQTIDLSCVNGLDKMDKYRAMVPEQIGNIGDKLEGDEPLETETVAPTTTAAPKARPMIGFPPPDKERPAAPAVNTYREPAPVRHDPPPPPLPPVHHYQAPQHYPEPAPTNTGSGKNNWRQLTNQHSAPAHQPPHYPQHHDPRYAPPPGYYQPPYDPRGQQPTGHYAPVPQYPGHQYDPRYAPPPPPNYTSGTPGRNAVALEQYHLEQQRRYEASLYQGGPSYGSHYYTR